MFFCLLLAAMPAMGAAEDFYRGNTINLVVGYGPGGGFDTLARLIAPELEKRTGATVVVRNIPGGGGVVALNQVAAARPDGLTLMLVNGQAAALGQLLSQPAVRYDLTAAATIGLVCPEPVVVLAGKDSPYQRIGDLRTAEKAVQWAAGGKIDVMGDAAACFSEALGLNAKIIIGYKGSSEAALSVMRGETDAIALTVSTANRYAQDGKLVPLAVLDRHRSDLMPAVPTIFETVELDARQAWWIDFRSDIAHLGRYLLTTPGTPPERVDYLAAAIKDILTDKDFIAYVRSKKRVIAYAEVAETNRRIEKILTLLAPEQRRQVRRVLLDKYY